MSDVADEDDEAIDAEQAAVLRRNLYFGVIPGMTVVLALLGLWIGTVKHDLPLTLGFFAVLDVGASAYVIVTVRRFIRRLMRPRDDP